jgi:predicted RNase H-like nuclease
VSAPSPNPSLVVGVDGYHRGWIAVVLDGGAFEEARVFNLFADLCETYAPAQCIAVDIPIGPGPRDADEEARKFVGPRWASVFPVPPGDILALDDYQEAVRRHPSLSRQSFSLFRRIREVAACVDGRVVEVHPEVSFRALKGAYLDEPKTSWDGFMERRALLEAAGIAVPDALGRGIPLVDVLDAAVAAWSARRVADGTAQSVGPGPRIWY